MLSFRARTRRLLESAVRRRARRQVHEPEFGRRRNRGVAREASIEVLRVVPRAVVDRPEAEPLDVGPLRVVPAGPPEAVEVEGDRSLAGAGQRPLPGDHVPRGIARREAEPRERTGAQDGGRGRPWGGPVEGAARVARHFAALAHDRAARAQPPLLELVEQVCLVVQRRKLSTPDTGPIDRIAGKIYIRS